MKFIRFIALIIISAMLISVAAGCRFVQGGSNKGENSTLLLHYSLDEPSGSLARESVSGKDYTINYVFNSQNADNLFKEPNDPLRRTGVKLNGSRRPRRLPISIRSTPSIF